MIRGEESHGSSINETPIQEAKCEVEEEKEPPHVEMETTSSEVFNFNGSSDMDLTDLLEYIKGKNYNCKEVLYVDTDVKEVFGLLKAKAKIPISSLVSFILEDWLTKHRNDISSLIKQKRTVFFSTEKGSFCETKDFWLGYRPVQWVFPHWTDILDRNNNFFRDSCIICYFFYRNIIFSHFYYNINIFFSNRRRYKRK